MKILLVNYRYFLSGGPERYMFSIKKVMEKNGHTVIPFSVKYCKNEKTDYDKYFVSPIGDESEVYFKDYKLGVKTALQILDRQFYSFEAKRKIETIIKDTKPDIAYILHFYNKLSPSVIDGCKAMELPIVLRISDFSLLCPNGLFLRNGEVCEKCISRNLFNAVKYKCVQNSVSGSLVKVLAMYFHRLITVFNKVDAYVVPSRFTVKKMIYGGFPEEKIYHVPTFVEDSRMEIEDVPQENYMLYFGRIARVKGVIYLIKAFELVKKKRKSNVELWIVGSSNDNEEKRLKDFVVSRNIQEVKFLGFKPELVLFQMVKKALFIVLPVIWYDNMPNVILESFALGRSVVGSKIGTIPELIDNGVNGLLFEPGNVEDLAAKIEWMIDHPKERREMGRRARELVEKEYNPELHYERLMEVYRRILAKDVVLV